MSRCSCWFSQIYINFEYIHLIHTLYEIGYPNSLHTNFVLRVRTRKPDGVDHILRFKQKSSELFCVRRVVMFVGNAYTLSFSYVETASASNAKVVPLLRRIPLFCTLGIRNFEDKDRCS